MPLSLFSTSSENISDVDVIIRKLLQWLLNSPNSESFNFTERWRLARAIFVARDPALLRALRDGLKDVLKTLKTQMKDNPNAELVLAYVLCLLPHAEMKSSNDIYEIPIWNHHTKTWDGVYYQAEPIELTALSGPEAFAMIDSERVFAYGLKPIQTATDNHDMKNQINQSSALNPPPILLFKGMPVPTGQGFATQWFANWFSTPGCWLLYTGQSRLQHWLTKNKMPARVFGFGQGGALACEMMLDKKMVDYIDEVTAYNPSNFNALKSDEYKKRWEDLYQNKAKKPSVKIIDQKNSTFYTNLAESLPNWTIKKIESSPSSGQFLNHILCYAAHAKNIDFSSEETQQTNKDRWWLNLMVNHLGRNLIFGLFVLPCHFLVIPVVRALLQHKTEAVVLCLMVFAFTTFPGMVATPLGITAAVLASLYLSYKLFNPVFQRLMGLTPVSDASCHAPEPSAGMVIR